MKNLDPRLLVLREEARQRAQAQALAGAAAGVEEVEIFVHFTGPLADLVACGLKNAVTAEAPGEPAIAAGTLPLSRLEDIAAVPHVRWIDPRDLLRPTLDVSLSEIRARNTSVALEEKGRGVIVGIVDDGLDYLHPAFRDPADSKRTRILTFWDQMGTGGVAPPGFDGLGIEHCRAALEELLNAESPPWTRGFHGTHVAAIALGNGQVSGDPNPVPGKYIGVAPEAELICVGVPAWHDMPPRRHDMPLRRMGHYRDTHICRGFKYIFDKAKALQRPVVINLSMGYPLGPHDGTSPLEKMIDRWIAQEPAGRIVVVAAGNDDGMMACHTEGTVPAGGQASVEINLSREHNSRGQRYSMDLWYQGPALLSVQVGVPQDQDSGVPAPTVSDEVLPGGSKLDWRANPSVPEDQQTKVNIYSYEKHEWNGCHRIFVEIITPKERPGPRGIWRLVLKNLGSAAVPFDVWSDQAPFTRYCPRKSLTTPSTAKNVITVGAYMARTDLAPPYDRMSPQPEDQSEVQGSSPQCNEGVTVSGQGPANFSLRGPARDGWPKPEIVAPGVSIYSALGRPLVPPDCCQPHPEYGAKDGTSMAAPMVAGVIALMLERNPALTHEQVREALIKTARKPADVSVWPDSRWGYGKINAAAAVTAIQKVSAPEPEPPTSLAKKPMITTPSAKGVSASRARSAEPTRARFLDRERLRALRDALAATPAGRRWGTLMATHSAEVYTLVNRNRSVTVTWHRNGGPQLVQAFLTSVQNLDQPLPIEVNGRPAARAMESILAVLRQHGSPELAADIDRSRDELLRLPGASFHQLLERLRATP
jgi:subtilisin family serine protease